MLAAAYRLLFRTILIRLEPETAHHYSVIVLRMLGARPIARALSRRTAPPATAAVQALGMSFPSPFGLAAGFDKDATAVAGLAALGFGHIEVGTITAHPQPGNPKPRLFRLPADRALINRMGFNNDGAQAVATRIARLRRRGGAPIVGINIGKSRIVDVDDAVEDYLTSTRLLAPVADYLVVNVSSPNTPGLRGLQELDRLRPLLTAVAGAAGSVPLLVKIAPDLEDEAIGHIAALVGELGLAGVVATNTTIDRSGLVTSATVVDAAGAGGLSGAPLAARSMAVLQILRAALPRTSCIISVGGVTTAADVRARLDAGATLVQGYTGFLYRGPGWARELSSQAR